MQVLDELKEKVEGTKEPLVGNVLEIVKHDNPFLREKSKPYLGDITTDTETQQLIADMLKTMQAYNAVGLAAVQVGVAVTILVVQDETRNPHIIINPVIVEEDEQKVHMVEGCLSFPGVFKPVWRAASVVVKYMDQDGKPVTAQADNLLGRAILHEMDHLNGILLTDRIPKVQKADVRRALELHDRKLARFKREQKERAEKMRKLLDKMEKTQKPIVVKDPEEPVT